MATLGNLPGLLGGALAGNQLAQQQQSLGQYQLVGTGNTYTNTLAVNYDWATDTVAYAQGAPRRSAHAYGPEPDSNLAWLDRRVDEVRVKL